MDPEELKVALVTGAGRGIGRAIAIELAAECYCLALAARSRDELEETRKLSGLEPRRCLIVAVDLAQAQAPETLIGAVLEHYGRLDVLINNAGWAPERMPLVKMSEAQCDRIIAVNLRASVALTRLAAPHMSSRGGAIINIASAAAREAAAGEAVYAAAKAGLIAFSRACFKELRAKGVKLTVIIPGLVNTGLIPPNKRLDRSMMLAPYDVAKTVCQLLGLPPDVCPLEIVLEPRFDPQRG